MALLKVCGLGVNLLFSVTTHLWIFPLVPNLFMPYLTHNCSNGHSISSPYLPIADTTLSYPHNVVSGPERASCAAAVLHLAPNACTLQVDINWDGYFVLEQLTGPAFPCLGIFSSANSSGFPIHPEVLLNLFFRVSSDHVSFLVL